MPSSPAPPAASAANSRKCCAREGFDLLIAADEPEIESAANEIRALGAAVETVQADLATIEGVDRAGGRRRRFGRPVDALLANAGRGLGHGFLDQDFAQARHVIDTNITGTVYLVHRVGNDMRRRNAGRIMIVGSIAGFIPGSFQAVYNGTKAFLDSFSFALREELRGSKVTVTCLMPGATETEFFERAGMLDTSVGTAKKASAADVARTGFAAMMRGDGDIVSGFKNKAAVGGGANHSGRLPGEAAPQIRRAGLGAILNDAAKKTRRSCA